MADQNVSPEHGFVVRFWGVRGAHPAPGSQHVGGHTPCVEVQVAGRRIILDAGLGIVPLGQRWPANETDVILFLTHLHRDHIEGLGFFVPLRRADTHCWIYGPRPPEQPLDSFLRTQLSPPVFPLQWDGLSAERHVTHIKDGDILALTSSAPMPTRVPSGDPAPDDVPLIRALFNPAHPQGVYLYKVEWREHAVVYATDVEGFVGGDRRLIEFARGADLLIHDAAYTREEYLSSEVSRQGWGHSTPEMAIEVAQAAGVPQVALFHHDPQHHDEMLMQMEVDAQTMFSGACLAREGMTMELKKGTYG